MKGYNNDSVPALLSSHAPWLNLPRHLNTMLISLHEVVAVEGEGSTYGRPRLYAGLVSLDKVVNGLEAFLVIRAHRVQTSQYAAGVW